MAPEYSITEQLVIVSIIHNKVSIDRSNNSIDTNERRSWQACRDKLARAGR